MGIYIFWGTTVVIALISVVVVALTAFFGYKGAFGFTELDDNKRLLVKSSFGDGIGSKILLVTRMGCFGLSATVMGTGIANNGWSFAFYTIWNYTALTILFLLLVLHSLADQLFGRQLPNIISRTTWILFQIEITNVLIVDIVVWTLLGGVTTDFVDINVHAINMGLMLLELVSNQIVLKPACVLFLMWVVMAYLATVLTLRDLNKLPNGNEWPYSFMEPGISAAPLWYLGLAAAHVIFFFVCYGLTRLKRRLCHANFEGSSGGYSLLNGVTTNASLSRFTIGGLQPATTAGYGSNPTFAAPGRVIGWDRAGGGGGDFNESTALLSKSTAASSGGNNVGQLSKPSNGLFNSEEPIDPAIDPGYYDVGVSVGVGTSDGSGGGGGGGNNDLDPSYMEPAVSASSISVGQEMPEELYADTEAGHLGSNSRGAGADYRVVAGRGQQRGGAGGTGGTVGTSGIGGTAAGTGADYRLIAGQLQL